MSYNGYSNWSTWNVHLWLDNDEGLYNHFRRPTRTASELEAEITEMFDSPGYFGEARKFGDIEDRKGPEGLDSVDWNELQASLYEEEEEEDRDNGRYEFDLEMLGPSATGNDGIDFMEILDDELARKDGLTGWDSLFCEDRAPDNSGVSERQQALIDEAWERALYRFAAERKA